MPFLASDRLEEHTVNRRRFFEYCAALSLSTSIASPSSASVEEEATTRTITVEDMARAEKLFDIQLTDEERERIVDAVNENVLYFRDLRERNLGNSLNLSLVYKPALPGMVFPKERRLARFSKVAVERPDSIEDVAFFSVLELAHLIESRQITSIELTRMYLSRLKRYNSRLQFVITLTEDLALEQARRADEEIASGTYRGSLHGIPYGLKDLFAVEGLKTTWGAEPYRDQVIHTTATVAERLEEAGAVLLAKLSMGRLASGDEWFGGQTMRPWDPTKRSGGSSAGPAAATAAGCVAFALGTETNGSIISPCHVNGVTGFRPTFGRVSRYGAMTLCWTLDKVGPICRSVEDCAVVLDAIHGPDGRDNSVVDLPFNWDPEMDISSLRIGYFTKYFEKELMGDPENPEDVEYYTKLRELSEEALDVFRQRGFELVALDFDIPIGGADMILEIEAATAFDDLTRSDRDDQLKDSSWPDIFRRMRFWPAIEYLQANRYRTLINEQMHTALSDVDVYIEITWSNNWLTNLTGHPAIIVPCGFIDENRPAGVTFVGHLYREAELLAVAKYFQDATDHHLRHPSL